MSGLPDTNIVGTLTADPELRFTPRGSAVVNFTVACNKRFYNKETGQWEDRDATFLRCNLWNQAAENVAESLSKGQRVMVMGELKQRSFETKDGEKRTTFEVEATEVGPSLKWATATVNKVSRNGGGGGFAPAPAEDPWAAPPASNSQGTAWTPGPDEPPF
ncbi:single-strand binding protein [Haloechinothrix alba]|uniref:Single-stranded DNA-binding protein n=1 Tax=Haloechinothrix alba TaxID=664784 RepID=A0A238WFU5_9PSEU|nr:single-stranded DNA-binding protein [Haloechinothrix alba]SNR44559.1 single-strand binding protein [Haloechinothrix alba]